MTDYFHNPYFGPYFPEGYFGQAGETPAGAMTAHLSGAATLAAFMTAPADIEADLGGASTLTATLAPVETESGGHGGGGYYYYHGGYLAPHPPIPIRTDIAARIGGRGRVAATMTAGAELAASIVAGSAVSAGMEETATGSRETTISGC